MSMYSMFEFEDHIMVLAIDYCELGEPPVHDPAWRGYFKTIEAARSFAAKRCGGKIMHVMMA